MSESQSQALVPIPSSNLATVEVGSAMSQMFFDEAKFTMLGRAAKMFAMSPLVPEHLKGHSKDEAIANCMICLALAMETGENPLVLMQSVYFVSGRAGWNATYVIAKANASGRFKGPLDWEVTGEGQGLTATCFATLAATGRRVQTTVDMATAHAEGWTRNKKYQTMPDLMLRYRSATLLVRLYAPELLLGYRSADELEDTAGERSVVPQAQLAPAPGIVQIRRPDPVPAPEQLPEQTTAAAPPSIWAEYDAVHRAFSAAHHGVIPDWVPEEVRDEAQARELMARMRAETPQGALP